MNYDFYNGGWDVSFLESQWPDSLALKLRFRDPEKIRELARKGEAIGTSED